MLRRRILCVAPAFLFLAVWATAGLGAEKTTSTRPAGPARIGGSKAPLPLAQTGQYGRQPARPAPAQPAAPRPAPGASPSAPPRTPPAPAVTPADRPSNRPVPLTPRLSMPMATSGDEREILIVQALEQPTSLLIEDAPIGDAIRMLSEKTGVPIQFDRFVLGCLPYGSKTMVTATIENRPLSESLTALLRPLASKYVLDGDRLLISPRPALFRICRRATWDEVALIEKLYSTPWSKELADSLEFQFQDMSDADAQSNRKKIYDLAASVGSGHAARVLEYACKQYGWEWYPEGKAIAFCTRTRQVERQLERTVTAQYSEVQLKEILLDLVGRAGLELILEPGVLASLPTHMAERFRLTLENITIRQALQLIAGETGLQYFIEPDGVRISANTFVSAAASQSPQVADAAAQAARTNPIVGQVTIPGENGTTYSFFVREEDLPPDVNQLRLRELSRMSSALRDVLSTRPE